MKNSTKLALMALITVIYALIVNINYDVYIIVISIYFAASFIARAVEANKLTIEWKAKK